ncbi:MAG: hypothetical protein AAF515_12820 [Pseudomonadota bacterium]
MSHSPSSINEAPRSSRHIAGYLARHADCPTDVEAIAAALDGARFANVLIVPAYDEPRDFATSVCPAGDRATLIVAVINAPDDAPRDARERTLATLPAPGSAWHLRALDGRRTVLTIDAATRPLPARRATGVARKIGNDLAIDLMQRAIIDSRWLHNSDADARLPPGHFERAEAAGTRTEAAAVIAPFRHHADGNEHALETAGALYELYMRYVAQQIHATGSPYGYPALGSVLSVSAPHYAAVRGFPRRNAAEDFYLLNKLAKIAPLVYAAGPPVRVAARASARVPFGTGPAIARLMTLIETNQLANYGVYAAASFAALRQFQAGARALAAESNRWPQAWLDPDVTYVLKRLGFPAAFERLQGAHSDTQRLRRAVWEWFDAGKTIRFLNECRHFHPDVPLIDQLPAGDDYATLCEAWESARAETLHGLAGTA